MNISGVSERINSMLDKFRKPASLLPALLLRCVSLKRPGLSPMEITSVAIENIKSTGIPTEENEDGTPNLVNEYTYSVVKAVTDALKQQGAIQVVIPAQSLMIQATGGNAGGPVTCIGTNLTDTVAYGIMQ